MRSVAHWRVCVCAYVCVWVCAKIYHRLEKPGTYAEVALSLIKEIYPQNPDKTKQSIISKEILLSLTKNGQADIKRDAKSSTDCCL